MANTLLVLAYGITIVASAILGGFLPHVIRMNHVRMQVVLSFVGGMMLGVAVLHLLPHGFMEIHGSALRSAPTEVTLRPLAAEERDAQESIRIGDTMAQTMRAMLVGLLVTFFMMRAFHFHQHGESDSDGHAHQHSDHGHCEHDHDERPRTKLGWLGVIFGLGLHTFMDGVALGAAVLYDSEHRHSISITPAGFSVYLAILLHKPLDALSLSTLMAAENRSPRAILWANMCFGLMCLAGAISAMYWPPLANGEWLGYLLAASAGVFLCISLSDLLPEVQFHRHDRLQLSAALLLGIGISLVIEIFHQH